MQQSAGPLALECSLCEFLPLPTFLGLGRGWGAGSRGFRYWPGESATRLPHSRPAEEPAVTSAADQQQPVRFWRGARHGEGLRRVIVGPPTLVPPSSWLEGPDGNLISARRRHRVSCFVKHGSWGRSWTAFALGSCPDEPAQYLRLRRETQRHRRCLTCRFQSISHVQQSPCGSPQALGRSAVAGWRAVLLHGGTC